MINGETIGVGVITCDRPHLLKKCCDSLADCPVIDHGMIVNDGKQLSDIYPKVDIGTPEEWEWYETTGYTGVGKAKNHALRYLMGKGCDHVFLIENDIFVKDPSVFENYIKASKVSGIQHFNYSQHGNANKIPMEFKEPNIRLLVNYKECEVAFYYHCVGAFSYYSKKCLDTVGIMDERYYNACEHVDHTYQIIKAGMHPPFWAFADIKDSWNYLGDDGWSIETSTISSSPDHHVMMKNADEIFTLKHGCVPMQVPFIDNDEIGQYLKDIRKKYGLQLG